MEKRPERVTTLEALIVEIPEIAGENTVGQASKVGLYLPDQPERALHAPPPTFCSKDAAMEPTFNKLVPETTKVEVFTKLDGFDSIDLMTDRPSCLELLSPHDTRTPLDVRAKECPSPAATDLNNSPRIFAVSICIANATSCLSRVSA
jgi:hypothetical protein